MRSSQRLAWVALPLLLLSLIASSALATETEIKKEIIVEENFEFPDQFDEGDYELELNENELIGQEYVSSAPGFGSPPPPVAYPEPNLSIPIETNVYPSPAASAAANYPLPAQASYAQPAPVKTYSAPLPSYQAPPVVESYSQPPPVKTYSAPLPSYQAPQVESYSQSASIKSYPLPSQPILDLYPLPPQAPLLPPLPPLLPPLPPPALPLPPPPLPPYLPPLPPVNYSLPPPILNYSLPLPPLNYSIPLIPRPAYPLNYTSALSVPLFKYSVNDLAPFIPLVNYRANHWSLFYYKASPYRTCPKNVYLSSPSYKDIEAAFQYALLQLKSSLNANIQYLNVTQPSFAARTQVFSFLTQQNARLDEEGLLIELVSQYLADRACLTKWDKQRYLPQLTKLISVSNLPGTHSCANYYQSRNKWQSNLGLYLNSRYRTIDGFGNNPYHPYWGKSNVCHIRLLSPDYADGISLPRNSYNPRYPLPNPRVVSSFIHGEVPLDSPYNLLKMQWGQFINHDISNTALSTYDGLVDCCKSPNIRGCWPIYVPPGDNFYGGYNVTCLNFIRSGVCPLCQLGPRQQLNKNTAFLDASQVYGNTPEQALAIRAFRGGLLKVSLGKNNEVLLPIGTSQEQCQGTCYLGGDSRVNQHPALTVLHTLLVRSHNIIAAQLALRHKNWSDEILFQETRRLVIAEYQMINYAEYLPIVFGPILSAYYKLLPSRGYTYYDPKVDPTTWNEYVTASCRFGHSQISSVFGLYSKISPYGQLDNKQQSFRLKDWYMRPSLLNDGLSVQILNGLISRPAQVVDPWLTNDVRNHLYQSGGRESHGGDLAATNIWRGRDHGIPGYINYIEYCFNLKVRNWKDLALFIPYHSLNQLKKVYKVVENIDLFTGGISERHFPGADIGPTFACINGIQYYHLKFGDRYYFEHGGQAGSFSPLQLDEIKRSSLARLLCRTGYLPAVPQYAFLQPSIYNPLLNCSLVGELDFNKF